MASALAAVAPLTFRCRFVLSGCSAGAHLDLLQGAFTQEEGYKMMHVVLQGS